MNEGQLHTATEFVEPLFNTFYRVVGSNGLHETLDSVIIDNKDPLQQDRIAELCKLNLTAGGTDRIMAYLEESVLGVEA